MRKHLGLIIGGFLLGFLVYSFVRFSEHQIPLEMALSGTLGILVAYGANFSNIVLNRSLPWKKQPGIRLLAGIVLQLVISAILVYVALWGYHRLVMPLFLFEEDPDDIGLKIGILLFCTVLLYNVVYFAYYSYQMYAQGQMSELKFERKQTQLQLNALKSQLSPHFLFNSINTLSSLFATNTDKAETFIRALADSYQYTLNTYKAPMVTVAEELEFVKAYGFLIRTRFGEHFELKTQLEEEVLESKVPPMTLQMLVENAVKHNVMNAKQPLNVLIKSNDKFIEVINNKTVERPRTKSLKIGLKNIASRYELLVQKSIEVVNTKDFTVRLPLVK